MQSLEELKAFAESNIISMKNLIETMQDKMSPVGDDPRHATMVDDFRVVFSVEQQPGGRARHASISNRKIKKLEEVDLNPLLKPLGFKSDAHDFNKGNNMSYVEMDMRSDTGPAINFIEFI